MTDFITDDFGNVVNTPTIAYLSLSAYGGEGEWCHRVAV